MPAVYQGNDAGAPCCAYINIMGENLQSRQEEAGEWALLISPRVHQQFSVVLLSHLLGFPSGRSQAASGEGPFSPGANALLP